MWSQTWHFLFEMLICISFRFIKAVGKHVRKKGRALFIFVLLIVSVEFMVLKDVKVITWLSFIFSTLNLGSAAHTMLFQLKTGEGIFNYENSSQHGNPFGIETLRQLRRRQSLTIDWNIRFILD